MQIKNIIEQAFLDSMTPEQEKAILDNITSSIVKAEQEKEEVLDSSVEIVLDSLKKVEANMIAKLNFEAKNIQKGKDGKNGPQGEKGERGNDGLNGKDGKDGVDGKDGQDGISIVDVRVALDNHIVVTLSNGEEIDAGVIEGDKSSSTVYATLKQTADTSAIYSSIADIQAQINAITGIDGTLGSMAQQENNAVAITGGSINGTTIGGTTPAAGTFTTLTGGGGSANYFQTQGSATTKSVEVKALGSDTNIAFVIDSKGTGAIDLAAGLSGVNISNGGTVTALTATNSGSAYTSVPSVAITAPTTAGGVQATATVAMTHLSASTVSNGGTGYTVNDVLTIVGGTTGTAAQFTVTSVSGGVVTGITRTGTSTYTVLPSSPSSTTGGTGTGCTIAVNWAINGSAFTITNAGSGYVEQPTVTFSGGGGGSGAAAYATVGSGTVVKSIGATLDIATPTFITSSIPVARFRDVGGADTFTQIQPNIGYTQVIAQGNSNGNLFLAANGTGRVSVQTNGTSQTEQLRVSHTASAVNYVQVTGAATAAYSQVSAQGSDTNTGILYTSKGTGEHRFSTGGSTTAIQFRVLHVNTPQNYCAVIGGGAGVAPQFQVLGTDTNIDLTLTPKGTGLVCFGTYTALGSTTFSIDGYIEIKDSSGTTRKLALIV